MIDTIQWAIKHNERNCAETGLTVLIDLMKNVSTMPVGGIFYQTYYWNIMQNIFVVMTDGLHKPGFKFQSAILCSMFQMVVTNTITTPLFNPAVVQYPDNATFVKTSVIRLLTESFPNMARFVVCVSSLCLRVCVSRVPGCVGVMHCPTDRGAGRQSGGRVHCGWNVLLLQ